MIASNDHTLSQLTVRLRNPNTLQIIGSGIIYHSKYLRDKIYVLTAAHCLYKDKDKFSQPLDAVKIDIYQSTTNKYVDVDHTIDYNLVSTHIDRDVAILVLDKSLIEAITGPLPEIAAIGERQSVTTFVAKGFPNATQGKELDLIQPTWKQEMTEVSKFQLQLNESYSAWATTGFSGSGLFLITHDKLYLFGIFTRFRPDEMGKVIYGQYLKTVNEVLQANFQSTIHLSFFGQHGLNESYFQRHVETAVKNLGPRFNEKLNLRMPVSKLFNVIAKDEYFKSRIIRYFDEWLSARYYLDQSENTQVKETKAALESTRDLVKEWLGKASWLPGQPIESNIATSAIDEFNELVSIKIDRLYELQREKQKEEVRGKRSYNYRAPFDKELDYLRSIRSSNHKLLNAIDTANVALADFPILLIKGEAGCGKSHLLGDIATARTRFNNPTLLLLGQLFKKESSIWQNIIDQLHLSCTRNELLVTLNNIGRQIGSRVLILIDALNEGDGKSIWPHELAAFISEVAQYPFIGLIMTVRSTYWAVVVPDGVQADNRITQITHQGFKGNEYEAMKLFCTYYGIQQPNFPILSPEYANPLFLQLVCEGVKASPGKIFPQGFQGISVLFSYYIKAINQKLSTKREEYQLRNKLAEQAIKEVAKATFANDSKPISLEAAVNLFDTQFSSYPRLLNDLIQENVFIQTLNRNYTTQTDEEVVYFSYERFGDFFIAQDILNGFKTREEAIVGFKMENPLIKSLLDQYYRHNGILEALTILLPEKFDLEIFEVLDWTFGNPDEQLKWIAEEWINLWLLESLKWRSVSSVNDVKLTQWFNSENFNIDFNTFLNSWVELVPIEGHPFNGDRFQFFLTNMSMAERDGLLQKFFLYYQGADDYESPFPIRRLIEWAWQPGISAKINIETARLTGQCLAWILSSTQRKLRDEATKALVNLLEEQPDALIAILKNFENVDDLYIQERLYAAAYGCALRTSNNSSLGLISKYVFETVFERDNPPPHILLRDYARNTVEYALYKQITFNGDISRIKPPYNSPMPEVMPSEADISKYHIDDNDPDNKREYIHEYNRIHFSVMTWDFSRYTIVSAFRGFSPFSFREEERSKHFIRLLKPKKREVVRLFITVYEDFELLKQREEDGRMSIRMGKQTLREFYEEHLTWSENLLTTTLSEPERLYINNQLIPHINNKLKSKSSWRHTFAIQPVKCWIVNRVFELGYQANLHGEYDSQIERFNNRSENKIERIGKKYQWIALYEMLAFVADNYLLREDYGNYEKYDYFQGPWQNYLRDVDPVFITKNPAAYDEDEKDENEGLITINTEDNWWSAGSYNFWNQPNANWAINTQDMPDPIYIIERHDKNETDWLYLHLNVTWNEPKGLGEDKYERLKKNMWYMFHAYIVKKSQKQKIVGWLGGQNLFGRWMPESHSQTGLFNRENYWSPISKYYQENQIWKQLDGSKYKVALATVEAVGEMSDDKSGAHFSYQMPSKLLFEGMGLQYAPKDGEFMNSKGEIVVTNINPKGVLIRKKDFLEFLNRENLDIIWALMGEKSVWSGHRLSEDTHFKTISGVYSLDNNGSLVGSFRVLERE